MEVFYAFGIICIKVLQDRFEELEWLMDTLNHVFNPNYQLEYIFPLISTFDSVFGAQLLLSIAFGAWCNTMLKWLLVEDRPFWWVHETTYYSNDDRPLLNQNGHTCETSPGSPSGHCAAAATIFMLAEMWISHMVRDLRSPRLEALYNKMPLKLFYFSTMALVGLARMYVGAHFPHQCILGALVGSFLSPSLCLFVVDPYLLRSGSSQEVRRTVTWHVLLACGAIALAMLLGLSYYVMGVDLHWSTRLAFRWCQSADFINVKSSPMFAIVQSTGTLLGWAMAVTPEVAKYRHDSQRNTLVAILGTTLVMYSFKQVQEYIPNRRVPFYTIHFALNLIRPFLFLRLVPKVAMATYISRPVRSSRQLKTSSPQLVAPGGVKRD